MRWLPLVLFSCASCAKSEPAPASPIEAVSVAPQSTGSPNEPTLLLGNPKPASARESGDVEHVKVKDEQPDASFQPPKDRCPDGITEMIAVHMALGEALELAPGATVVSALGSSEAADVVYDRIRRIARITAKKYGLVFVLTEREGKCTWYGVNAGY